MAKEKEVLIDFTDHKELSMRQLVVVISEALRMADHSSEMPVKLHRDVFAAALQLISAEISQIMVKMAISKDKYKAELDPLIIETLALDLKLQVQKSLDAFNERMIGVTSREQMKERIEAMVRDRKDNENVH
ncbi:TPA: hypothetical protein ACRZZI_004933 [Vibrio harveyi]